MTPQITKKVGLDLRFLDRHINAVPDLCPIDTYMGRLTAEQYKVAARLWEKTFPAGVTARLGITDPKSKYTGETLCRRFGAPSLSYNAFGDRVAWVFTNPDESLVVAIDHGIFRPSITLCIKAPNFEKGIEILNEVLDKYP